MAYSNQYLKDELLYYHFESIFVVFDVYVQKRYPRMLSKFIYSFCQIWLEPELEFESYDRNDCDTDSFPSKMIGIKMLNYECFHIITTETNTHGERYTKTPK